MNAPGFDLTARLYDPKIRVGERVTEEHRLAYSGLAFFVASVLDEEPEEVTLGDLMRFLRSQGRHGREVEGGRG